MASSPSRRCPRIAMSRHCRRSLSLSRRMRRTMAHHPLSPSFLLTPMPTSHHRYRLDISPSVDSHGLPSANADFSYHCPHTFMLGKGEERPTDREEEKKRRKKESVTDTTMA